MENVWLFVYALLSLAPKSRATLHVSGHAAAIKHNWIVARACHAPAPIHAMLMVSVMADAVRKYTRWQASASVLMRPVNLQRL